MKSPCFILMYEYLSTDSSVLHWECAAHQNLYLKNRVSEIVLINNSQCVVFDQLCHIHLLLDQPHFVANRDHHHEHDPSNQFLLKGNHKSNQNLFLLENIQVYKNQDAIYLKDRCCNLILLNIQVRFFLRPRPNLWFFDIGLVIPSLSADLPVMSSALVGLQVG